jgi:DNA-directed RNA polymerase specialized sigma24 family protein
MLNPTLTNVEIAKIVTDYASIIELAVLDVLEYQPSELFQAIDDVISDATVAVMISLRSFKREHLSTANVTAWIRKSARWTAMNAVDTFITRASLAHKCDTRTAVDSLRQQDQAQLEAALDVLDDERRSILVSLMSGEAAGSIAKRMKLSGPTITRRKQEAMKQIAAAMAA